MTIRFLHHPYVDSFSFWIKSKFYIWFVRGAGQGKWAIIYVEKILKCKQLWNLIFEYNLSIVIEIQRQTPDFIYTVWFVYN